MKLTDYQLKNTTSYINGYGNIVLVGMLENGPVGQPFTISSDKNIKALLGNNPTTRYSEYLEAVGIDRDAIIFYRINGSNAKYIAEWDGEEVFEFVGIDGNDKQNNVLITFSEEGLSIRSNYTEDQLEEGEENYVRTYRYDDFPYTSQLADAINGDAVLGLLDIVGRELINAPTHSLFPIGEVQLSGGNKEDNLIGRTEWEEESKKQYFNMFQTYVLGEVHEEYMHSNIMNIHSEVIMYPDINVNDFKEIAELSAFICKQKTEDELTMCYTVMKTREVPSDDVHLDEEFIPGTEFMIRENPKLAPAANPYEDQSLSPEELYKPYQRQEAFVQELLELFDGNKQTLEHFKYLMVAVGDMSPETHADLPLAAMIAGTSPSDRVSNVGVPAFTLKNALAPSMFARLKDKGYTYIVPSVRKNYVFQKVQSMDLYTEDRILKEWTNQRTFAQMHKALDVIFESYISRPMSYMTQQMLEDELNDFIDDFKQRGRLQSGTVRTIEFSAINHKIDIEIDLIFYQELNIVRGSVEIKKDGWDIDLWNITN